MANDAPSAPTALARTSPQPLASIRSFQPNSISELIEVSKMLSASGMIPDSLRGKPQDIATIIMHGASLGFDAMAAIRSIHCIKGKPVLSADGTVALCVSRRDVCLSWKKIESTDTIATFETTRVGNDPTRLSFTIEQARQAGLAGGDNWRKYPAAMLRARCIAALARLVYPDLVAGIYDPEEPPVDQPSQPVDVTPVDHSAPLFAPVPALAAPPPPPIVVAPPPSTDEQPPSAPPEPQPAPVADPADALVRDVAAAVTLHDLEKIVLPKIQKAGLVGESRAKVAAAYSARRTALATGRVS